MTNKISDVGPAHFKSIVRQQRNNNYNLIKVFNEFIDNVIKKCNTINIETIINDGYLYEIKISDDYEKGFENINKTGSSNPFNMGHMRDGQDDDNETSEFGIGMKAGAIAAANKFTIYTKVLNKYYKIYFDFVKMMGEFDINKSYNPQFSNISEEEYKHNHPFEYGSTLILQEIRKEIYPETTQEYITLVIKEEISGIYGKIIDKNNINISVNKNKIGNVYDFFEDPKCKLFTQYAKLYYLINKVDNTQLFLIEYPNRDKSKYLIFDIFNKTKNDMDHDRLKESPNKLEYYKNNDNFEFKYCLDENNKECMSIYSTFTYFTDNDNKITRDIVQIYKDNRRYGNVITKNHNNGAHNYTIHKIEFVSKKLGKEFGMTYNKEILLNLDNNITKCVKSIIDKHRTLFTCDTSTKKFKDLNEKYDELFKSEEKLEEKIEIYDKKPIKKEKSKKVVEKNIKPVKQKKPINSKKSDKDKSDEDKSYEDKSDEDKSKDNSSEEDGEDETNYYVYIIQSVGNIGTNIYKIGMTTESDPNIRLRKYDKGYIIKYLIEIQSSEFDDFEKVVLDKFSEKFTNKKSLGKEWFEGDIKSMKKCISELYCQKKLNF
jgi:hypothetical protein